MRRVARPRVGNVNCGVELEPATRGRGHGPRARADNQRRPTRDQSGADAEACAGAGADCTVVDAYPTAFLGTGSKNMTHSAIDTMPSPAQTNTQRVPRGANGGDGAGPGGQLQQRHVLVPRCAGERRVLCAGVLGGEEGAACMHVMHGGWGMPSAPVATPRIGTPIQNQTVRAQVGHRA